MERGSIPLKFEGRPMSLRNRIETWIPFGVFADLWRAARLRGQGRSNEGPFALEVAYASRFAGPTQPSVATVPVGLPSQSFKELKAA